MGRSLSASAGDVLGMMRGALRGCARRKPARAWLERHAQFMSWSYAGLLAAAAAEGLTRMPGFGFWWVVVAVSFAVIVAGGFVIGHFEPLSRLAVGPGRRPEVKP